MLTGKYLDSYLRDAGKDAPHFTAEDMRIIGSPIDFIGVNIYVAKEYVLAAGHSPKNTRGYHVAPMSESRPRIFSPWHTFSPEALYWEPRLIHSIWKPREIYITENGCAAADILADDGQIYDTDRIMYLRNVMTQLHRATAEGIPVKGNFISSAFDNLEWTDGFGARFGLIYVDFSSQKRTPKLSARWFHEAASRNGVV